MKKIILLSAFIFSLGLAGCGETTEENLGGEVENTENNENTGNDTSGDTEEAATNDEKELNQVIVDNENLTATLVKIVKKNDEVWGNTVEVIFDVTNKRKDSIEVQANSVSVDDRMVDETLLSMSQEVAPGKSATATLTISEFEGYDFPAFENNFEMILHVFSWDDYDYSEDHPVKVEF
ncbi:hypothetical protein SAMN05880501_107109 [Ureibacillus xyleni]|uniref:DUF4352 domain-containing protein n=1 Tax=Ureibacillus xyleni TaxID=614648 RepID=A0A285SXN3_9BACL|nr:hypothetical protein [Ureibacillus xyleni]SOC13133.1 hypothetical protein SAMN05880501_107109 [Ureibacillus xyleni]